MALIRLIVILLLLVIHELLAIQLFGSHVTVTPRDINELIFDIIFLIVIVWVLWFAPPITDKSKEL